MRNLLKVGLAAASVAGAATIKIGALAAESPLGVWLDHTGRGAVEITECGGGAVCGKVVWVEDQKNSKGCGLQILGDVKPMGDGTFDEGWIYDPDKDAKFDVALEPHGDKLTVVGYKGIKLFSQTFMWTRAPADLTRCHKA
jgi:uncharacterized protein (DUF2147 family)